jgi:alternate signal-mediated exported protein
MKRFKNLSLKKKRALVIASAAIVLVAIGGTIAYHNDSMFFKNFFHLGASVEEYSEVFDSPDNWQPCEEIEKTAIATNRNDAPRYVRMKINEYWRKKNTTTPADDHTTTDLPLTWDDNGTEKSYAIVNMQNEDRWELKSDGWYYYDTALRKDESTLSLLRSVMMNCDANLVSGVSYDNGHLAGESVPNDYAQAKYHLFITFQMSAEAF